MKAFRPVRITTSGSASAAAIRFCLSRINWSSSGAGMRTSFPETRGWTGTELSPWSVC